MGAGATSGAITRAFTETKQLKRPEDADRCPNEAYVSGAGCESATVPKPVFAIAGTDCQLQAGYIVRTYYIRQRAANNRRV